MYLTHYRSQGTGVHGLGGLGLWACPTLLIVNERRSIRAVESTKLPRKTFLKNECNGEKNFLARCNFLAALQLLLMHKVPSHVILLRSYTYKVFSLCHKYRSGASQPLITIHHCLIQKTKLLYTQQNFLLKYSITVAHFFRISLLKNWNKGCLQSCNCKVGTFVIRVSLYIFQGMVCVPSTICPLQIGFFQVN